MIRSKHDGVSCHACLLPNPTRLSQPTKDLKKVDTTRQVEVPTMAGRGLTKLVDLMLSGCRAPLFLVISKGRQAAVVYMLRTLWVRSPPAPTRVEFSRGLEMQLLAGRVMMS
jgi:hypothetical protein